jgi:hypothetical protein
MDNQIIPQDRAEPMTEGRRAYHRRRCEPTVRRIWQAAKDGKVARSTVANIVWQNGQRLDQRLERYRRYGFDLPEVIDDRRKCNPARPPVKRLPFAAYALPDRLDPDGCLTLAATLLTAAVEDIRGGRDVDQAIRFLWSDLAALIFDSLGIDRQVAMGAMEEHLCD